METDAVASEAPARYGGASPPEGFRSDAMSLTIEFDQGSLLVTDLPEPIAALVPGCQFDKRVGKHRLEAYRYAALCLALHHRKIPYEDNARAYAVLQLRRTLSRTPRDYQAEALTAWKKSARRGVVVLPTGAGKTFVATLAITDVNRSTLVIVPTLDLLHQWYDLLAASFDAPVGSLGGGNYDLQDLTVTTYDSAYLYAERLGNRFGLVIFDECHHLPGPSYTESARLNIAPFRLGLTATPERADGRETVLGELVGPEVYRKDIREMTGEFLAPYTVQKMRISLTGEEREAYDRNRKRYRDFVSSRGLRVGSRGGWRQFLIECARSEEGRAAYRAWRKQKEIVRSAAAKLKAVQSLMREHKGERVLVFTEDNATVYRLSRALLVPAITHRTKAKERRETLVRFNAGSYTTIVTSKVLNEGVNIPEANVAIVLSGSGSVREHVQRLGRILRPGKGKQAVLYELVAADTAEEYTSKRRRQHTAYGMLLDSC